MGPARYTDEELSTIDGAGTRRVVLSALRRPVQLKAFGLLNYPLPAGNDP